MKWSLSNSCEGKFNVAERVKARGDMGGFILTITKIHNHHYCECTTWKFGKKRHFNMNCLESMGEKLRRGYATTKRKR